MKRSDVTYGQLDKVLKSLGFSSRVVAVDPRSTRLYEHKKSGAYFMLPPYPMSDRAYAGHVVVARTIVDNFGIADRKKFDQKLRKVAEAG